MNDQPAVRTTRAIDRYLRAPLNAQHWKTLIRAPRVYRDLWTGFAYRYVLGRGRYPYQPAVRVGDQIVRPTIYGLHDFYTVHEVFVWQCYEVDRSIRSFVDFGANIGISALYFLSRNHSCSGYIYEPVPSNFARLQDNLRHVSDRVEMYETAVYSYSGTVYLGVEPTGRYSGVGHTTPEQIEVRSENVNAALDRALGREGEIDVVKIDIEGSEKAIIPIIDRTILSRIRLVYVEGECDDLGSLPECGFVRAPHIPGVLKFVNTRPPR